MIPLCPLTYLVIVSLLLVILTDHSQALDTLTLNSSTGGGQGQGSYVYNSTVPDHCRLVAPSLYMTELRGLLDKGAKLVEVTISIEGHEDDMLYSQLTRVYRPYHWVRSTSRQGRSLLMLDENYDYLSLTTLSIGVEELSTNLTDVPENCFNSSLAEKDLIHILRTSFLNDFKPKEDDNTPLLSPDEHICNMLVVEDGGSASFRYHCCSHDQDGNLICTDILADIWIQILMGLIVAIKILVLLYSPSFLPESMYRQKYDAIQYIYELKEPITLKVVVTQNPYRFETGDETDQGNKRLKLSTLKNMDHFKTMVSSAGWRHDQIYEIKVRHVRLSVKCRRLLDQNTVNIYLTKILYNNLIRCRIRRLSPLTKCCDTKICGTRNPGCKVMKWFHCMRLFSRFCLMVLIALPWIIRVLMYYDSEAEINAEMEKAANRVGLTIGWKYSLVSYCTPLHVVFLFIYGLLVVDSLIYGVITQAMREKFKFVMRQSLRNMRERSKLKVLGWVTNLLLMPFQTIGLLALVIYVPYLLFIIILTGPVVAFYTFPTLNLSIRLIIQVFIFLVGLCKRNNNKKSSTKPTCFKNWTTLKKIMLIDDMTAGEKFVNKSEYTTIGLILQVFVVIMCLISFWSVTILASELFTFFVEMLVYTFMGIIVNAGVTMQFVTLFVLLYLYSKSTFSRVHLIYQAYHKWDSQLDIHPVA